MGNINIADDNTFELIVYLEIRSNEKHCQHQTKIYVSMDTAHNISIGIYTD